MLTGLCSKIILQFSDYAQHSDAILLVVVPAAQAPEIASSRALRLALEFDPESKHYLIICYVFVIALNENLL